MFLLGFVLPKNRSARHLKGTPGLRPGIPGKYFDSAPARGVRP